MDEVGILSRYLAGNATLGTAINRNVYAVALAKYQCIASTDINRGITQYGGNAQQVHARNGIQIEQGHGIIYARVSIEYNFQSGLSCIGLISVSLSRR